MGLGFSMGWGVEAFLALVYNGDPIQVGMACSTDGRNMPKPKSPVNQIHKPLSPSRFTPMNRNSTYVKAMFLSSLELCMLLPPLDEISIKDSLLALQKARPTRPDNFGNLWP